MHTQTQDKSENREDSNEQKVSLRSSLFKHCNDGDTGIVFIKTKNNKACKIFVTEGEVEAISMGRLSGPEAALELKKQGIQGASYSERFNLPYADSNAINSSDTLLKQFGFVARNPPRVSS